MGERFGAGPSVRPIDLLIRLWRAETPYTLLTSTYQAAILCQYNAADVYTLDELARATSIPKSYLKAILSTLVKPKILLEDGETYRLNVGT